MWMEGISNKEIVYVFGIYGKMVYIYKCNICMKFYMDNWYFFFFMFLEKID